MRGMESPDLDTRRPAAPARTAGVTGSRVLVIDAYPPGRQALCACISLLGHEAIDGDGADAVRRSVASRALDLVIARCHSVRDRALLAEIHAADPTLPLVILHFPEDVAISFEDVMVLTEPLSLPTVERLIGLVARRAPAPS